MKNVFDVRPHEGVGPLRFGMTRDQTRAAIRQPFSLFRRSQSAANDSDRFRDVPMFAYYRDDGTLEAVEFARGAAVRWDDRDLSGTSVASLTQVFSALDPDLNVGRDDGFLSPRFGIAVWTEGELDEPPQSILVHAPGYYDD